MKKINLKVDESEMKSLEKKWGVILRLNQKVMELEEEVERNRQTMIHLRANARGPSKEKKLRGLAALEKLEFPALAQKNEFKGHRDGVTCVSLHESESFLVTGSSDSTLRVYDIELNVQVALLRGHTHSVNGVGWWNDQIVSGSSDMSIRIWGSLNKQNSLDFDQFSTIKILVGHDHSVSRLVIRSNTMISVSRDTTVKFWDLEQKICKRTLADPRQEWLRAVDANENYVLVAGNDNRVWVYDYIKLMSSSREGKNGEKLAEECLITDFPAHENVIESVSISQAVQSDKKKLAYLGVPAEHICVTSSRDKLVKVFNFMKGDCILSFSGHANWVKGVRLIAEKGWVLSAGEDKTLRIWSIPKKKQIYLKSGCHSHFLTDVEFDLTRMMILSTSVDKTCKLWSLLSQNEIRLLGLV